MYNFIDELSKHNGFTTLNDELKEEFEVPKLDSWKREERLNFRFQKRLLKMIMIAVLD